MTRRSLLLPIALGAAAGLLLSQSGFFFFMLWPPFALLMAPVLRRMGLESRREALIAVGSMCLTVLGVIELHKVFEGYYERFGFIPYDVFLRLAFVAITFGLAALTIRNVRKAEDGRERA